MDQSSYTRVTEIIKPFSGVEFIPARYLEPAANRGTQVHFEIQNLLMGFERPMEWITENEGLIGYLKSFERFWKDSMHAFVDSKIVLEKRLFCEENKITGQIDCLIHTEEQTFMFDWKTSSKVQERSWRLQAAGYRFLCEVNGISNLADPVFVKLDKFGKDPILFKCDKYDEDLDRFFNCLDLYRYFDMQNRRSNG